MGKLKMEGKSNSLFLYCGKMGHQNKKRISPHEKLSPSLIYQKDFFIYIILIIFFVRYKKLLNYLKFQDYILQGF